MQHMMRGECHRLVNMSHMLAIMNVPIIIVIAGGMMTARMMIRQCLVHFDF